MTPENFVSQIHKSIVDENLGIYKDLFSSTDIQNATDPNWGRALRLYDAARQAANRANQELRRANPTKYLRQEIHEIHPVKLGGSPTDPANKIPLPSSVHRTQVTPWWSRFLRNLEEGS